MGLEAPDERGPKAAAVVLSLLVPVALLLGGVRMLLTDAFVQIEYRSPGFPTDPYGFDMGDRLKWAPIALQYLLNDAGIDFLADQRFDSGEPVFNDRELHHMQDVKQLTQAVLRAWPVSLLNVGMLCLVIYIWAGPSLVWKALARGSLLTLLLMALLTLGVAAAFQFVFVGFHLIFFEGDTWLFKYSDTLIRLFPERFWRDTFIALVVGTVAQALILRWISRWAGGGERSDDKRAEAA
jgi:integral membrane protein (TIGR01906 family)